MDEQRYEYRTRLDRAAGGAPLLVAMEHLSEARQAESVGWLLEARPVGRWRLFDSGSIPGVVHVRQPNSATVHAGVLIDGWRLDSSGENYSTFCGPKAGADRLVETDGGVSCKRCQSSLSSPGRPNEARTMIAWHAREIERLTRLAEL